MQNRKAVSEVLVAGSNTESIDNISLTFSSLLTDWKVLVASNDKNCINVIKHDDQIELVVLDFDFVDTSSFSLIEQIRKCSKVPVVVLSSKKDEPMLLKAFNMGVDDYIVKPFNEHIFIARIKAIVRRKNGFGNVKVDKVESHSDMGLIEKKHNSNGLLALSS